MKCYILIEVKTGEGKTLIISFLFTSIAIIDIYDFDMIINKLFRLSLDYYEAKYINKENKHYLIEEKNYIKNL
jgi:hypothetical protein